MEDNMNASTPPPLPQEQDVVMGEPIEVTYDESYKKFTNTFTYKVLFIAILSLLLLIPSL